MKQFFSFVRKEFLHVLRDRKTLFILFGMPVVQILIFGFALTNEVKNSNLLVLDWSKDAASQALVQEVEASRYFDVVEVANSEAQLEQAFQAGRARVALVIPPAFEQSLRHGEAVQVQSINDASDPNTATTLTNYLNAIVNDFRMLRFHDAPPPLVMNTEVRMLYNPQLKGAPNFVPGVMAMVLMLVCVMLTAVSIVREKELGTMEVMLVSPFKPLLVIVAKAFPYFLLSIVNVTSILLLSNYVLDVPVVGSLWLLYGVSMLFIITSLSIGILISVQTASQQVAMLISLMGMLLPTLLFSGFMFPIENMPVPLQVISNIIPAKWYFLLVKAVMIKGLGISAIWKEMLVLTGMTLFFLAVSLKKFKIRLS